MSISTVENSLIALTETRLGKTIKKVDSLAGEFDTDTLRRLVRQAPGVFWSFLGGRLLQSPQDDTRLSAQWGMYIVTAHASGEKARRLGDQREIGAYDLIAQLVPYFNGMTLPGVGTLQLGRVQNLFNGTFEKQGVAVYAASFSLPMTLELPVDAALDDFITFHADIDIPAFEDPAEHDKWLQEPPDHTTSVPDADQTITLEQ